MTYQISNPNTAIPRKELLARGYCCGLECLNCPYDPPHKEGVKKIKNKENIQTGSGAVR